MKLKSQLEAILFLSDKPVKAAAMARIVGQDVHIVRQSLLELIHDYEERDGGLEIADEDGYIIQVRDAYASIVDEFAPMEMPVALIRTLSAIAIKQPVAQSEIIKIRGAGAYDHIKDLIVRELILKKEEGGRSPFLSTTKKFQEYFRLTQDAKVLRTQLNTEGREAREAAASAGVDGATVQENDLDYADINIAAQSEAATTHDTGDEALSIDHLTSGKSKINLERVFAESPDASFVFRPTEKDVLNAAASEKEDDETVLEQGHLTGELSN